MYQATIIAPIDNSIGDNGNAVIIAKSLTQVDIANLTTIGVKVDDISAKPLTLYSDLATLVSCVKSQLTNLDFDQIIVIGDSDIFAAINNAYSDNDCVSVITLSDLVQIFNICN